MGDFLLGFGLLPYELPLRRRALPLLSRPLQPLGPDARSAKFQGPGPVVHLWHCIII